MSYTFPFFNSNSPVSALENQLNSPAGTIGAKSNIVLTPASEQNTALFLLSQPAGKTTPISYYINPQTTNQAVHYLLTNSNVAGNPLYDSIQSIPNAISSDVNGIGSAVSSDVNGISKNIGSAISSVSSGIGNAISTTEILVLLGAIAITYLILKNPESTKSLLAA